jgi:hypothetical protein
VIRSLAFVLVCAFTAPAGAESLSLRDAASAPASFDLASAAEWSYQDSAVTASEALTPGKAVLWSLLLPGLGDWKMGNRNRAATFFAVEGVIWASFIAFELQGQDFEDEYQSLANRFAGITEGHSDEFYATLRDFDSSEEYEAEIKNEGRNYDTGSEYLDQYFTENRVADYEPWLWESTDRRLQYSETRSASKTAYRRTDYMLAAAAANRVVSAVFAFGAAKSLAKHDVGLDIDLSPRGDVAFALTKRF